MFAAAHPVGKTRGCGRALAPGFGLHPEVVTLRAHACLFYKCLQHVPLTSCRDPWPNGPWSTTKHGRGIHSTNMQVGKKGALCAKTLKHGFPLRIHSKLCRIQGGLRNQVPADNLHVCSQLKRVMKCIGHRAAFPAEAGP